MIKAADLFCGAGGASTGLLRAAKALGVDVDLLAVNHWPTAVETHSLNHPHVRHMCEAVERIDPREAVPGGRLHLLMAGPECFPAGTLILTSRGLVPIEQVVSGDRVLTHRNRWREVVMTNSRTASTVIVRGKGHYGLETTAEHPFLTRQRKRRYTKANRNGVWTWEAEPVWRAAWRLAERRPSAGRTFWATPIHVPEQAIPMAWSATAAFWWVVGRWVGDGYVDSRPRRGGVISIACNHAEADLLTPRLRAGFNSVVWTKRRTRTASLIECRHRDLSEWLVTHFGKLAHGKKIPAWLLGAPREWRAAFLDGYISADGSHTARKTEATTVSKALAIGVRLLAESLGHRVSLHKATARHNPIEGRRVNVRDHYHLVWTDRPERSFTGVDEAHAWGHVRQVRPGRQDVTVYNFSVEDDESYVADGIVVHNCTHFSSARGGRPVNQQSRATAWHILKWAQELYIDTILIENVPEFRTWGPVNADGRPSKRHKGETYRAFLAALKSLGYRVEDRILNAADYGDPTTRKRLFIMARRGRHQVRWPTPTHSRTGSPTLFGERKRWRPARDVIDWSLKGRSIFTRPKPLRPATIARILAGLEKFGGTELRPFLVVLRQHMGARSLDDPIPTIAAQGQHVGVATPFLMPVTHAGASRGRSVDDPLPTITVATRGELAVVEPFILQQQSGGAPRSTHEPLPTIATDGAISVVEPFLVPYNGSAREARVHSVGDPLRTQTTENRFGLAQPFLVPMYGEREGQGARTHSVEDPVTTIPATGGGKFGVVEPFVTKYTSTGQAYSTDQPLDTITTRDRFALVEPFLVPNNTNNAPRSINEPVPTVTGGNRIALVQPVIDGYVLDIHFRMLQPHELAAATSFPKSYVFHGNREDVVKQIGNSWPGELAKALAGEVVRDYAPKRRLRRTA